MGEGFSNQASRLGSFAENIAIEKGLVTRLVGSMCSVRTSKCVKGVWDQAVEVIPVLTATQRISTKMAFLFAEERTELFSIEKITAYL